MIPLTPGAIIGMEEVQYRVKEGEGPASVCVSLLGELSSNVVVTLETGDMGGDEGATGEGGERVSGEGGSGEGVSGEGGSGKEVGGERVSGEGGSGEGVSGKEVGGEGGRE